MNVTFGNGMFVNSKDLSNIATVEDLSKAIKQVEILGVSHNAKMANLQYVEVSNSIIECPEIDIKCEFTPTKRLKASFDCLKVAVNKWHIKHCLKRGDLLYLAYNHKSYKTRKKNIKRLAKMI